MYVKVMILFCTRSLRYSSDVLCGKAGLGAPIADGTVSERIDCVSHSLPRYGLVVGVVDEKGCGPRLVVIGAMGGVGLVLKDASKF